MDNQTKMKEPSPEMLEFIEITTNALIKAGQEARKVAEMTGTPLVIRSKMPEATSFLRGK